MPEEKREFRGIWISKEIWLDENLSAIEKVILAEIDSMSSKNGFHASNAYLSKFCQCSERYITQSISKLIKLKYIEVASFDGRQRFLKSNLKNTSEQSRKDCGAESQKDESHNNSNNNSNYNNNNKDNNSSCASDERTPNNSEAANSKLPQTKNPPEYEQLFEKLWKLYPKKLGKQSVSIKFKKEILNIGYERFSAAIQKYKDEIASNNTLEKYIKYGSTFFNGGYLDYLDDETDFNATPPSTDSVYDANGYRTVSF